MRYAIPLFQRGVRRTGCFISPSRTGFFLFGVKKTSVASLSAIKDIKAYEKTKNTG